MEDFEIVELFLKRDENAIAETEKKYGGKLFKLAFSILSDRQFAEECVNDACMKAWQSIPPNEPYGYLLPYLLKITRSISLNMAKCMSAAKRNAALSELTSPSVADEPEKITPHVGELLDELLWKSTELIGKPVGLMNKDDKMRAIRYLNSKGALLITKSGDKIATYFGISKFTLYSYLTDEEESD